MAEIKMSYIFIEKQKHESKAMQEILLEVNCRGDSYVCLPAV